MDPIVSMNEWNHAMRHDRTSRIVATGRIRPHSRSSAFTLVELLIVLLIIALLAALVLPGFSSATASARETNLIDNLRHVRTQLLVYTAQHGGAAPGYPDGNKNAAPDADVFVAQMTGYTDKIGRVSPSGNPDADYAMGPYLRKVPTNPINLSAAVRIVSAHDSFPSGPSGAEGWLYQPTTLTFVANVPGQDKTGRPYFDY